MELKDHNLVEYNDYKWILYEERPCLDRSGNPVEDLHNVWIILNNPKQFNSYTTDMVKEVVLAFRRASNDRACVAVVFTGVGDKAFCTGGNTKEYAEYYAGNPQEYMQYMRLFNDMVTSILTCDRPVVCRVNGMRIAGGQEIGMACDFSIAQDLARFGQAGPIHGSAAIGGSTDFLHLYVGVERAMWSLTLCEPWSAHKAFHIGLLTDVVPALKVDGEFVPNPMVITDRFTDEYGRIVYGDYKTGEERDKAKEIMAKGEVDLSLLDKRIDKFCTQILYTMPNCITKTLVETRKKKLQHWNANKESSRDWLGLNMMTEAKAGFRAFNEGPQGNREVDFVRLRQLLAKGEPWTDDLIKEISPQYKK